MAAEAAGAPPGLTSRLHLDRGGGFDEAPPLTAPIEPGAFAVEFRIPPGPAVRSVRWHPLAGRGCRCRVLAVETDGEYRGVGWKSTLWSVDGWDEFLGVEPQYVLEGRFDGATWLRVRGELQLPDPELLMRELDAARALGERQRRIALHARRETLNARRQAAHERRVALFARHEADTIRGSISWRATAPVRALLDPFVKRLRPPVEPLGDAVSEDEIQEALALEGAVADAPEPSWAAGVALQADPSGSVSVAIPVYNGSRFLGETIESVLNQTHPPAEVVLVDDASTDDSAEVALAFSRRDRRVRLVRNERNAGMVANWNRAVEFCTGDWVKLMGQDDRLEPECLGTMLAANAAGHDLIVSLRDFSFEPGVPRAIWHAYRFNLPTLETLAVEPGTVTPAQLARLITRVSPCTNLLGEPVCGLFRRARFAAAGPFNTTLRQVVDYEFWLRLALTAPFTYVDQPLAIFRVHGGSATQANLANRLRGVHVDHAILLVELLEGAVFAEARRLHPPLADFVRQSLVAEVATIQRLAKRAPEARETLERALAEYPPLAPWCRRTTTLADRLRALAARLRRAPGYLTRS